MSYQALARTWRPKNFETLVGQEHVAQALKNALDHNKLHHAYLFSGTRGSGKTTIARIFAKCLNCEKGVSSTPCGECNTCVAIDEGRFLDLIEVDAASRTRVEETRELLDNVQYKPTQGRFKVYLIDEVHMLSNHSFNALLKTLEEPPAYVKFLLATTDPEKCPVTILSRCLQFHLKHMTPAQISQHLAFILNHEKIFFEAPALTNISIAAQGSMRDALSLLDQAIAYSNQHVTTAHVQNMLGLLEQSHLWNLMDALSQKNGALLLKHITALAEHTSNFDNALTNLLSLLHQISVEQLAPQSISANNPDTAPIQQYAQKFSPEEVQLFYQTALTGRRDIHLAPSLRCGFEMTLLRMLAPQRKLTIKTDAPQAPISAQTTTIMTPPVEKSTPIIITKNPAAISQKQINTGWPELLQQLKLTGLTLSLAQNCSLEMMNDHEIKLQLGTAHAPLLSDKQTLRIEEALSKHFGKPFKTSIRVTTQTTPSPAVIQEQIFKKNHETAHEKISNDTKVQDLLKAFDADLDPNMVEADKT